MALNREQIKMIEVIQSNRRLYLECDRQIGSTLLLLSYAINHAIENDGKVLFVCQNDDSITHTINNCFKLNEHNNIKSNRRELYYGRSGQVKFITYRNIQSIRGYKHTLIIFDNVKYSSVTYQNIIACASSMVNTGKFLILISGEITNNEFSGFTKHQIRKIKKIKLWTTKN